MPGHPLFPHRRIFAPGPTPVPEAVRARLAEEPLHHRTREFGAILGRVTEGLRTLFQTAQRPYVLASSGTGAMETTVVNLFRPGEEVLVVEAGKFGERWGAMAERFGLTVHRLRLPWGHSVTPEAVREALKKHRKIAGVLFQACETSTGALHPTEAIARVVRSESEALVVVDAITALGVLDVPMDRWDLDVVVSGSQKALMLPPGLAFLALSPRAQARRKRAGAPRFYFDLNEEDSAALTGETAWTPAVGLIQGLDTVLERFRAVGLEAVFRHHERLAEATRQGVRALGLELFAKDAPAPGLTAVKVPPGVDGKKLVALLRDRFAMTVAGGQDACAGKIFRIAHLGYFDELDMISVLSATQMVLSALGYRCPPGAAVAAAEEVFLASMR